MRIYFDNAATTPIHPEVIQLMNNLMLEVYGNPSSIHQSGRKAKTIVEDARKTVASILNTSIGEIFFTSSATESNNAILRKSVEDFGIECIITSPTEHPCVLNTAKELEKKNLITLKYLSVDKTGLVSPEELDLFLSSGSTKTLVSIMYVNNEIGTIQDIEKIGEICKKHNALLHCDAVQAIGKINIDLQKINIDFLSGTAHKFHGPKGIGFMYIKNDHLFQPFITGGGQERNMRSGTENVHGMAGLALALKLYHEGRDEKMEKIKNLKDSFKRGLQSVINDVQFIEDAPGAHTAPHILSVSFPENPKTELMTFNLDIAGISASAGSACSSGVEQASHVLAAIGFPEDRRAVRFSFSYLNTEEEVELSISKIKKMLSS